MKIHQSALREVTFKDVYQLSRHRFDVSMFEQNSTWLPWLKKLPLYHYSHPNLFSYEVLRPLLGMSVSKKSIRRINQQSRKVQTYLIQGIGRHEQYLEIIKLLQKYPPRIVLDVFEALNEEVYWRVDEELQTLLFPRVRLIVGRWAEYFMPMVGKVKVRKQREQWQRALMQLKDVLGWLTNTNGQVHKNQTWYALMQQHERWIEQLNAEQLAKAAEIDALTWEGAEWTDFDSKGIEIKELTTGLELRIEGQEMEHCVFSYLNSCVRGRYRVFSLRSDNERATLGLYQHPVSQHLQYDQLRGARNQLSSKIMEQITQMLISQINANV
ncbi:PcfJ domain-containing protein [Vibrio sp. TBV020]|uniref:PcfJ domain-containing protein n=1 Tax=Vibrio sp. TBV020 TaxID=3137398 RepID=UPI0038CD236C